MCVSNVYVTLPAVSSLSVCGKLCLTDTTCQAATYHSVSLECQLSQSAVTQACDLQQEDGTLTEKPEPVSKCHYTNTVRTYASSRTECHMDPVLCGYNFTLRSSVAIEKLSLVPSKK